jgi:hypothetical protein
MKETGILFTPENIRLVRHGAKVQTRRVITPQPTLEPNVGFVWKGRAYGRGMYDDDQEGQAARNFVHKCPYGKVGDRLYVKEGVITHVSIPQLVGYYMDGCRVTEPWEKRVTAMFMPKSMARTWLEITNVRVERVQDISEEDSIAEGVSPQIVTEQDIQDTINGTSEPHIKELARILGPGQFTAKFKYQELWDSINKAKHPWAQNPFVWVLEFRKI